MVINSFNSRNIKRLVIFCSLFSFIVAGNVFAARVSSVHNCRHSRAQAAANVGPSGFFGRFGSWFNRRNAARLFWLGLGAATTTTILGNDALDGTGKVLAISGILSIIFFLSRFTSAIDRIGDIFESAKGILDRTTREDVKDVLKGGIGEQVRAGVHEEFAPLRESAERTLGEVGVTTRALAVTARTLQSARGWLLGGGPSQELQDQARNEGTDVSQRETRADWVPTE